MAKHIIFVICLNDENYSITTKSDVLVRQDLASMRIFHLKQESELLKHASKEGSKLTHASKEKKLAKMILASKDVLVVEKKNKKILKWSD